MEKKATPPQVTFLDEPLSPMRGEKLLLGSLRTLSVQSFALPFAQPGRVREALRLRLLPLLGQGLEQTLVVPRIRERRGKGCVGETWIVRRDELESLLRQGTDVRLWPAPLALVRPDVRGVLAVREQEGIGALFVSEGQVRGYGWMRTSSDSEEVLLRQAEALGCSGEVTLRDLGDPQDRERLRREALEAWEVHPLLREFDLSLRGVAHAESRNRSLHTLKRLSQVLGAGGILFSVVAGGLWFDGLRTQEALRLAQDRVYREAFAAPPAGDPLSEARRRLRRPGAASGLPFGDLLSLVGETLKAQGGGIRLDSLRYGADKTELQGTAAATEGIQAFRKRLDDGPVAASMGDLQQVPGGGYRFVLTLKGDRP